MPVADAKKTFLASRSLYAVARPSVVCLSVCNVRSWRLSSSSSVVVCNTPRRRICYVTHQGGSKRRRASSVIVRNSWTVTRCVVILTDCKTVTLLTDPWQFCSCITMNRVYEEQCLRWDVILEMFYYWSASVPRWTYNRADISPWRRRVIAGSCVSSWRMRSKPISTAISPYAIWKKASR